MKKKILGILVCTLLIVTAVLPVVGSVEKNYELLDNTQDVTINSDDQLDQYQLEYEKMWTHNIPGKGAQSFKPTLKILTRVELSLCRTGSPDGDFVVSIHDSLTEESLTSASIYIKDVSICPSLCWFEFDFPDIEITPEQTYYIVYNPVSTHPPQTSIYWGFSEINQYLRGNVWVRRTDTLEWIMFNDMNFCFKTYGYAENQAEIVIDSIEGGFRSSAVIKNNGTATANDVNWSIDLEGGLILAGDHTEGVLDELVPGATTTIRQATLYGIGRTTITVTVGDATEKATGFILGPLVLGV